MEKIYKKIIKENLTLEAASKLIKPKISAQGLRYRLVKFCKENGLEIPKQKRGAKPKVLKIK